MNGAAGDIGDDGAGDTEGEVTFALATTAHYADLEADVTYQYDIQVKLSGRTLPTTLEKGMLTLAAEVTHSTR